jgi:predicted outer membrane protein
MSRATRVLVLGLAGTAAMAVWAQTPSPDHPAEAPADAVAPRPAHSPDAAALENSPAGKKANPADPTAPPLADPLKQEALTDAPPPIVTPPTLFATTAALDGLAEVKLGQMAITHSRNPQVIRLARHLIGDHERTNTALRAIAARKSITTATDLDAAHQAVLKNLDGRHGAEFDAAYVSQTVTAHENAIALFTAASQQSDAEIAAFAAKTLPMLKSHETMARSLQSSLTAAR